MILNFKTRREARSHCWKMQLPLTSISKSTRGGSHPWQVLQEETIFAVGKDYRLVDVEGFTNNGKNTANKVQARQIQDYLNGVITITRKEGDGKLHFKTPAGVVMSMIRAHEAKYFVEVKPTKAKKPKAAKIVKVEVAKTPVNDLDSALDGGVNLAPAAPVAKPAVQPVKELNPTNFVEQRAYTLIDERGFLKAHNRNADIVQWAKTHTNGIFVVVKTDFDGDARLTTEHNVIPVIKHHERKFFRELGAGNVPVIKPAPVAPAKPSIAVDVAEQKAKEKHDRAILKAAQDVEDALKEHQDAIQNLQQAARKVRVAAQTLANVSRS